MATAVFVQYNLVAYIDVDRSLKWARGSAARLTPGWHRQRLMNTSISIVMPPPMRRSQFD
jgi:hypothetical protein